MSLDNCTYRITKPAGDEAFDYDTADFTGSDPVEVASGRATQVASPEMLRPYREGDYAIDMDMMLYVDRSVAETAEQDQIVDILTGPMVGSFVITGIDVQDRLKGRIFAVARKNSKGASA